MTECHKVTERHKVMERHKETERHKVTQRHKVTERPKLTDRPKKTDHPKVTSVNVSLADIRRLLRLHWRQRQQQAAHVCIGSMCLLTPL